MSRLSFRTLALAALAVASLPALAAAQEPRRREVPGFDFPRDGVWRRQARSVRAVRQTALSRGDLAALNAPVQRARAAGPAALLAPGARPSGMAVSGVLRVPIFLVKYRNTDSTTLRPPADYDAALLGVTPPAGRPYTIRTYYEELSNGLLSVQGQVVGWILLDSSDTFYEGSQNGLSSDGRVSTLMREAVQKRDAAVDYGRFDNDGPDGVANSGDDDGEVDLAVFVFPEIGGECGPSTNKNIWAHRFFYAGWTGDFLQTSDARTGGGTIRVNSYTIQSGLGGATACDPADILPPGTIAHETGHGFGLIDLYDTNPNDADDSEGIGHWGLMSSGNYRRPFSPAYMEGWSRLQLGWVTVRDLTTSGTYELGPYAAGDTVFRILPTQPNPRGEFFLLENRQGAGSSDTALVTSKGPGLLIFHIDSLQVLQRSDFNDVNSGPIHGVWLRQADGLDQLRSSLTGVVNRGDAGDPYPGTSGNVAFGIGRSPEARLNSGGLAGVVVDSIRQLTPGGAMALRFRTGGITVVRASDTLALVQVRGTTPNVFRDVTAVGDTLTIGIDSAQFGESQRTQYLFQGWSDGGARTHVITATGSSQTFTANVTRKHRVSVVIDAGTGTITSRLPVTQPGGVVLPELDTITVTAVPGPGFAFAGWYSAGIEADTIAGEATLLLRLAHPFELSATFLAQLAVVDTVLGPGTMGASYTDTLRVSGGAGNHGFARVAGTLPPGVVLSAGGVLTGIPEATGTFSFTVRVTSGGLQLDLPVRVVVAAPTLVPSAVGDQLLLGGSHLTADEIRYLDLLGNRNGVLDIGDVAAWIDTGVTLDAAMRRRLLGGRP